MEQHELVDIKGNKTGKVLTHSEARDTNNVPNGCYISVVGVVIINDDHEILLQKRSRFKRDNPSKWGICGGKVDLINYILRYIMLEKILVSKNVNYKKRNLKK